MTWGASTMKDERLRFGPRHRTYQDRIGASPTSLAYAQRRCLWKICDVVGKVCERRRKKEQHIMMMVDFRSSRNQE